MWEIGAALQQSTAGFAPQIVHVQVQFRELLAAAGKEPAVRSPVRSVANGVEPQGRPGLLIISDANLVAEHLRIGSERLAIGIVPS